MSDVLTIGHSNHPIETFFDRLAMAEIGTLVDVRSHPVSKWNPQFERSQLETTLPAIGVPYRWAGQFLGGRPSGDHLIRDGIACYEAMAKEAHFERGVARVMDLAAETRPVLMCSERDPLDCHRCLLVSRRLIELGARVSHIGFDGSVEDHAAAETRLLQVVEKSRGGKKALAEAQDPLQTAYRLRAARVAWRPKDDLDGEAR